MHKLAYLVLSKLELSDGTAKMAEAEEKRYGDLSEDEIDELNKAIDNENTGKVVKKHVNHFRSYLVEKGFDGNFEHHDKKTLCKELKLFFANSRKKGGTLYKLNSYNQCFFAIKKFLSQNNIDITTEDFTTLKETLKMMRKKIAKSGKAKVDHKEPLSREDIVKLYSPGKM